jgi:hypothetical protein
MTMGCWPLARWMAALRPYLIVLHRRELKHSGARGGFRCGVNYLDSASLTLASFIRRAFMRFVIVLSAVPWRSAHIRVQGSLLLG